MLSFSLHLQLILLVLGAGSNAATVNYDVLNGHNFPDPCIINVGGVSYAFGTSDGAGNSIPMTSNSDFSNAAGWAAVSDAFPYTNVPAFGSNGWAAPYSAWAPDVNHFTDFDGTFGMYYSPQLQGDSLKRHCIGLARSRTVTGPYNDSSTHPLICPKAAGGAIDAAGFLDSNNARYIVYKIDGPAITNGGYCNNPNNPPSTNTSLMLQQVQNDGYTVIGGPSVLYNNQGVSDKYNVEAPAIVRSNGGVYFLFFSSGCTSDNSYTVSYVTSINGVRGPYGKRKVLLQTGDYGLYAPGGADMDKKTGDFVFHSFKASNDISQGRVLDTTHVTLSGRTASIS